MLGWAGWWLIGVRMGWMVVDRCYDGLDGGVVTEGESVMLRWWRFDGDDAEEWL